MKKGALLICGLAAVLCFQSCTVQQRTMADSNARLNLTTEDFVISEPYGGYGQSIKVLGIDWARLFGYRAGYKTTGSYSIMGFGGQLTPVENYALYDLMQRHPNFDVIIYPGFKKKQFTIPIFYQKTTVDVTARLGRLDTGGAGAAQDSE